jgi:hypothetical protein
MSWGYLFQRIQLWLKDLLVYWIIYVPFSEHLQHNTTWVNWWELTAVIQHTLTMTTIKPSTFLRMLKRDSLSFAVTFTWNKIKVWNKIHCSHFQGLFIISLHIVLFSQNAQAHARSQFGQHMPFIRLLTTKYMAYARFRKSRIAWMEANFSHSL